MNVIDEALQAHFDQLSGSASDSRRIFHGRGHCYPGLEAVTIDWFEPVVMATLYKPLPTDAEKALVTSLISCLTNSAVVAVCLQRRYLSGAPTEVLAGELPEAVFARRGDLRFHLKIGERQNSGYFLDMEPGRQWLEQRCAGKKVLNLFAYTCAFSVVAQQAGAAEVVNVDMSRAALSQGRDNHRLNHQSLDNIRFLGENILKSWGRIRRPGPYDIAVIDPPSYQPGSFVAARDYPKILRRIPELMVAGGELLICLNAPELGEEFMRASLQDACPDCRVSSRLEPHPDFPDRDPDQQLKLFHCCYEPPLES